MCTFILLIPIFASCKMYFQYLFDLKIQTQKKMLHLQTLWVQLRSTVVDCWFVCEDVSLSLTRVFSYYLYPLMIICSAGFSCCSHHGCSLSHWCEKLFIIWQHYKWKHNYTRYWHQYRPRVIMMQDDAIVKLMVQFRDPFEYLNCVIWQS